MAKKLTDVQKALRLVAYQEAITALEMWKSDQNKIQKEQADFVIKQIDTIMIRWFRSISPIGDIQDSNYEYY